MSVIDHVKDIYENSEYLSAEYAISEYILNHITIIHNLHLSDIAEGAFVSKGTVSKFMKKMTAEGTFESFQYSIAMQKNAFQNSTLHIQKNAKEYVERHKDIYAASKKDIDLIVDKLCYAHKVIFVTARSCRICFSPLARVLRESGKNVRFIGSYYKKSTKDEYLSLSSDDLIIQINPGDSIYEESMMEVIETDLPKYRFKIKADFIYLGKASADTGNIKAVNIKIDDNEFLQREYLEILGARIVLRYLKTEEK